MTNKQLVEFAKSRLNIKTAYMWGAFGNLITESFIQQKARQYPKYYSEARQALLRSYIGKNYYGCDCAGLIKWFLWTDGGAHGIRYNASQDKGTEGMYNSAKVKGKIADMPETPGLIVYMKGHVGVYIGNGEVVECTLGANGDGCVKTKLKARKDKQWTNYFEHEDIQYVKDPVNPVPTPTNEINIGDDVIINGPLYPNANAVKATGTATNKRTKITRKLPTTKHPYNTTGDLGWMDASSIKKVNQTTTPNKPTPTVPVSNTVEMTVNTRFGVYYHNNNKRWSSKTILGLFAYGKKINVIKGSEKRLGKYTCVSVKLDNGQIVYCAKNFLK